MTRSFCKNFSHTEFLSNCSFMAKLLQVSDRRIYVAKLLRVMHPNRKRRLQTNCRSWRMSIYTHGLERIPLMIRYSLASLLPQHGDCFSLWCFTLLEMGSSVTKSSLHAILKSTEGRFCASACRFSTNYIINCLNERVTESPTDRFDQVK